MKTFYLFLILGLSACGSDNNDQGKNILSLSKMGIIGVDNRTPVKDTTVYPYSSVGKISGFSGGTGALISPTVVLTAAHVAKDYASFFNPGYTKGKKILGSYNVSKIIYPERYIKNNCLEKNEMNILKSQKWACYSYDFAFLILERPILNLPYFKIQPFLKVDELKLQLDSIGYGISNSSIQKKQNKLCQGYRMNFAVNEMNLYYDKTDLNNFKKYIPIIINDCDGRSGDSGSPLLKVKEGKYTIVGVQVNISTESSTPEWNTLGEPFEDSEWFNKTYYSSTRAISGQIILDEINNNQELKKMIP